MGATFQGDAPSHFRNPQPEFGEGFVPGQRVQRIRRIATFNGRRATLQRSDDDPTLRKYLRGTNPKGRRAKKDQNM